MHMCSAHYKHQNTAISYCHYIYSHPLLTSSGLSLSSLGLAYPIKSTVTKKLSLYMLLGQDAICTDLPSCPPFSLLLFLHLLLVEWIWHLLTLARLKKGNDNSFQRKNSHLGH